MAHWQLKALINLDPKAALDFGLRQLSELCGIQFGVHPIEEVRSKASFGEATAQEILATISLHPKQTVAARAAILSSLVAVSFTSAADIAEEIVSHAVIAAREGFTEYAPYNISVFVMFKHSMGLHKEASALAEVAASFLHRIASP